MLFLGTLSPVLDKNLAPMGPEILSSTGAGVWRKAPRAFPDSSSVLDKFQSASYIRGPRNSAFGKPCPCPRDTRHFRHFHGARAAKPLF